MSQLNEVFALNPGHGVEPQDQVMAEAVIRSMAVALFTAQVTGLIRFPAGDLTIGEIEGRLDACAAAFTQKLIESKPS